MSDGDGAANDTINMSSLSNYVESERKYFAAQGKYWNDSDGTEIEKLSSFARFVPRQAIATFLARERIFRHITSIHGHIVECGVFRGAGLFSWAQLSAIHEPYNHVRRVIGFDTFGGFPEISQSDGSNDIDFKRAGGLCASVENEIRQGIAQYDLNRPLGHLPRCELVVGDACETIPAYVNENKHLVVALLYLDFDLYNPTRIAIETFWPRMPKGAVIAFDELNQKLWPGETMAVLDTIGIGSLRIERFDFNPQICFAVKE